jgi:hypothetical protein
MITDIENKLLLLKSSLEKLSKPYNEQVNSYPDFVDVFDEVISDFDDAFRLLPALMEKKIVSYSTIYELLKCNNLIELNLSVEDKKTDESFESDKSWNLVREYANNALNLLSNDMNGDILDGHLH